MIAPRPRRGRAAIRAAALVTALVLVSWPLGVPPLLDLETLAPVPGAHLVHRAAYLLLSPVCDVLDALTLLSVRQTLALIASLAVLYVLWRVVRWRRRGGTAWREARLALRALGAFVAFYGLGILAPRPMASLALADPDAVKVDVHSHTNWSHDARADFDVRANLAWHRAAGFDVTYITDHKSFDGAALAMRLNPPRAGDGLVALSGLEFIENNDHINALGATERNAMWIRVDIRRARPHLPPARRIEPVLVQTIPEDLSTVPAPDTEGRRGVLAIELSDGAPRGIEQGQRDRALILRIADSLDLALVAGSNNHGWGRTAVAWSVVRIPGWRTMTPDSLGAAIEQSIRTERRHGVRIVARRSPDPGRSRLALAATLPAVAWNLFVTLSPAQRASWIAWSWLVASLATFAPAWRRRHPAT